MDDSTISRLFDKIDCIKKDVTEIKVTIASLPCGTHDEKFRSNRENIKNIMLMIKTHWGVTILILTGLVGVAWKSF